MKSQTPSDPKPGISLGFSVSHRPVKECRESIQIGRRETSDGGQKEKKMIESHVASVLLPKKAINLLQHGEWYLNGDQMPLNFDYRQMVAMNDHWISMNG